MTELKIVYTKEEAKPKAVKIKIVGTPKPDAKAPTRIIIKRNGE